MRLIFLVNNYRWISKLGLLFSPEQKRRGVMASPLYYVWHALLPQFPLYIRYTVQRIFGDACALHGFK